MSALILTAAAGVSDAAAAQAAEAAGGAPIDRLGPAGVALAAPADALAAARAALADATIDVNWVAEARPRKLFLADMDSTIVTVECIDELAAEAGVGERVASITEQAMRGELDFEGALKARVALLKGLEVAVAERVAETRVPLSPGRRDAGADDERARRADGAGLGRFHLLHLTRRGADRLSASPRQYA